VGITSKSTSKPLKVRSYSGHTYPERPVSFSWRGVEHTVQEVEKEWREPGQRRFRVRTEDGKRFELCYDTQTDKWSVTELV
jgi:hypothetical protein